MCLPLHLAAFGPREPLSGLKRAKVALARRLGVILHRMWLDGTVFRYAGRVKPPATDREGEEPNQLSSNVPARARLRKGRGRGSTSSLMTTTLMPAALDLACTFPA